MSSQPKAVSLIHVDRAYQQKFILKDFSLEVSKSSFVSVLGASGSGKSTLLRLIAGLDPVTSGKMDVPSPRPFHQSFVFQEANLIPWKSVEENLQWVLDLTGLRGSLKQTLDRVGLWEHRQKYPHQLSGGMRMRAAVARALLTEPDLLLLDEPFSALDENLRQQLQEELFLIWKERKMTVIFVTHSISEAVFLSERTVILGGSPAQVVWDHSSALSGNRDFRLRADSSYLAEVQLVTEAFRRESHR